MKKIGEYTARGICIEGQADQIPLFDGKFDTAYRIVDFKVWSSDYDSNSGPDVLGKLSKNEFGVTDPVNFMRADDDNQIAWAASAGGAQGGLGFAEGPILDKDNLVVEDLYVYVLSSNAAAKVNYLVTMEKYQISDWQGALAMARDRAQGDL